MRNKSFRSRGLWIGLILYAVVLVAGVNEAQSDPIDLTVPFATDSRQQVIVRFKQDPIIEFGNSVYGYSIQSASDQLLDTMSVAGVEVREIQRYQTIPYMAMQVDAAGWAALQNDPNVEVVMLDRQHELAVWDTNQILGVPQVWQQSYDGTGYAIAVMDTGVDTTHPVFGAPNKVLAEACFSTNGTDGVTVATCPNGGDEQIGPGAAEPPSDAACLTCYHGTHVAGVATGNGDLISTPQGMTETFRGIAPGAGLVAINAFSLKTTNRTSTAFDSDIIAALEYILQLVTDGPDGNPTTDDALPIAAVNMSFGQSYYSAHCDTASTYPYFDLVNQLRSLGVVTVAATGNQSFESGISFPACLSNIVAVGASDASVGPEIVASFSNTAPIVDLLAPGVSVTSSVPIGTGQAGTNYRTGNGTSIATPYVAGAFVLLKQRFPNASWDDLLDQLSMTGVPLTDHNVTSSRIQVDKALQLADPELVEPLGVIVDQQPIFTWKRMPLIERYDVQVFDAVTNVRVLLVQDFTACSGDVCGFGGGTLSNGRPYYWTVQGRNGSLVSAVVQGNFEIKFNLPNGTIIDDTPDFVFKHNSFAQRYELEVTDTMTGSVLHQALYDAAAVCQNSICTINPQVQFGIYVGDRALSWRYRTEGGGWNGPYAFTVRAPATLPVAPITNIEGTATVDVNLLTDGINTAQWYRLFIYAHDIQQIVFDQWLHTAEADSCTTTTCTFTLDTPLYNNLAYTLYVNAYTEDLGYSAWSIGQEFAVHAPAPSVDWLRVLGVHDRVVLGQTTTTRTPCILTGHSQACGQALPYVEVAYDVGGYSGEWLRIVVYEPDSKAIVHDKWVNVRDDVTCNHSVDLGGQPGTSCIHLLTDYPGTGNYIIYVSSYGSGGYSTGGIVGYTNPDDTKHKAYFTIGLLDMQVTGLATTTSIPYVKTGGMTTSMVISGEVTFSWDHEPSALWYHLKVDQDGGAYFDKWYKVGTDVICVSGRCSLLTDQEFVNGQYEWTMGFWDGKLSRESQMAQFGIQGDRADLPVINEFAVSVSELIESNTAPQFEWSHVENATWYQLYVQTAAGEQVILEDYRALDICSPTICEVAPHVHLTDDLYKWYLRARGSGGASLGGIKNTGWVGPGTFTMSGTATGQPTSIAPTNKVLDTSYPTFRWNTATNASWYRLKIVEQATGNIAWNEWYYLPAEACLGDVCEITLAEPLANSPAYIWTVTPYGAAGMGRPSFERFFAISAETAEIAGLLAPIHDVVVPNTITFRWQKVYAIWYGLDVLDSSGNVVFSQWYPVEDLKCDTEGCSVSLDAQALAGGTYSWAVSTWVPANGTIVTTSSSATFIKL